MGSNSSSPVRVVPLHEAPESDLRGERDPLLASLGERLRDLRARRGMTRRALAEAADVSQRHLANLEAGVGNASILVLAQVARALGCPLDELVCEPPGPSAEWLMIRDLLAHRSDADLARARVAITELFGAQRRAPRREHIALIGLRGAGKTTLGRGLAESIGYAFVDLSRDIERLAGCTVQEVHSLYGVNAYRRYERRALEEALQIYPEAVIATPGGLVSEPGTFNLLLEHCLTIWLRASPEEHMARVMAQGDFRPMQGNAEAMQDLRQILAGREPFYAKADLVFDTSGRTVEDSLAGLKDAIARAR